MKTSSITTSVTTYVRELNAEDIILAFHKTGIYIPMNSQVFVNVPTGGDYSGCRLDIGKDVPLIIISTKETIEKDKK